MSLTRTGSGNKPFGILRSRQVFLKQSLISGIQPLVQTTLRRRANNWVLIFIMAMVSCTNINAATLKKIKLD